MLIDKYPHAKKAGIVAGLGIVISFPAIFVNLSAPDLGIWEIYSLALFVLKLIVAYFLFAVLKSIVNDYANQALINRTKSVYTFYIAIHLSVLMLMSFSMNIAEDQWVDTYIHADNGRLSYGYHVSSTTCSHSCRAKPYRQLTTIRYEDIGNWEG